MLAFALGLPVTADLDALVARLRDYAKCDFVHAGYWRCTPPTVDAGGDCEEAADALLALRTARGDFERAELARARAEVARDAAEALAAHLPERWYSCETMDAVRKERDAALRELADANASIAHAAEAYSAAIRERNIAQADTARLDKAIAVLAKFLEAQSREHKARRVGEGAQGG